MRRNPLAKRPQKMSTKLGDQAEAAVD